MKLTNRQVVQSVPAINVLNTLKLPVKASFRVAKTSKELDSVLTVYNETLKKLQEEYCERDEEGAVKTDGNQIVFKDASAFQTAFTELLDLESEVSVRTVKLDDLGSVEVEPSVLYQLDWLLEED
jgi:hypothetical protein